MTIVNRYFIGPPQSNKFFTKIISNRIFYRKKKKYSTLGKVLNPPSKFAYPDGMDGNNGSRSIRAGTGACPYEVL
jgi:hypothetical protein